MDGPLNEKSRYPTPGRRSPPCREESKLVPHRHHALVGDRRRQRRGRQGGVDDEPVDRVIATGRAGIEFRVNVAQCRWARSPRSKSALIPPGGSWTESPSGRGPGSRAASFGKRVRLVVTVVRRGWGVGRQGGSVVQGIDEQPVVARSVPIRLNEVFGVRRELCVWGSARRRHDVGLAERIFGEPVSEPVGVKPTVEESRASPSRWRTRSRRYTQAWRCRTRQWRCKCRCCRHRAGRSHRSTGSGNVRVGGVERVNRVGTRRISRGADGQELVLGVTSRPFASTVPTTNS